MNQSPDGSEPAAYRGDWPGHQYFPSPADWRNESVYQFITDRLRDGNPRNNDGRHGGYDLYDVGARHGGDFRGIKDALPYIKSLGFTAIWISPIFQNQFNSYHGYAQIDFTTLDDRFGTLSEFREMVAEAHRLGLYVIVDIVVNHMANLYYFEGHRDGGAPFRLHQGEYRLFERQPGSHYADFRVDNTFYPHGVYASVWGYDGFERFDTHGQGSFWFSDFHHNGDLHDYGDPWQNHLGKIYGSMDDLRTSHPRVQDKIIAMTRALISSTDIDGIRMDTPMQVPLYFFQRWAPAVKEHARRLGKDNFFIFGEFYCPRERAATMVGRGRRPDQWGQPYSFIGDTYTMDGGINYDLYFQFFQPALKYQQGHIDAAMRVLRDDLRAYDFHDPDRGEVRYGMLNFYNNHDQWRLSWEEDGDRKTALGSGIIAFWPGIPLFYYGDEQGLASQGTALDGWSREDFMTSKAWYGVAARRGTNPAIGDNFDMTGRDFLWVQRLMNVRRQYPALRNTHEVVERWVQPGGANGIYAFSRVWGPPGEWALVAFNTWKFGLHAGAELGRLETGWREGDEIVNLLAPAERITLGPGGTIPRLDLDGYAIKVFVRADALRPLDPVVEAVTPQHDSRVSGDEQTITLRFSEEMDRDSLIAAFRFDGQAVSPAALDYDPASRTLRHRTRASDGLHFVEIGEEARSRAGRHLHGRFRARFRRGGELDPIASPRRDPVQDPGLARLAPDDRHSVLLEHKAAGAVMYRVSTDGGARFGEWQPYRQQTSIDVSGWAPGRHTIRVQYWADGSAAYFSEGSVELPAD